jgi:hypothetical protein
MVIYTDLQQAYTQLKKQSGFSCINEAELISSIKGIDTYRIHYTEFVNGAKAQDCTVVQVYQS